MMAQARNFSPSWERGRLLIDDHPAFSIIIGHKGKKGKKISFDDSSWGLSPASFNEVQQFFRIVKIVVVAPDALAMVNDSPFLVPLQTGQ